jgi:signal transduction histidine kinase
MNTKALLLASWHSWYSQDFRHVGPRWLQYVWTFFFGAVVAIVFAVLGIAVNAGHIRSLEALASELWSSYLQNLVVSVFVSYTIHLLLDLGGWLIGVQRLRSLPKHQRSLFFTLVPAAGLIIGWPIGMWLVFGEFGKFLPMHRPSAWAGTITIVLLICGAFFIYFRVKHRELDAERRATDAQLKLLQGQIEPHFLFNTLANVLSLMEVDTPRARAMLESFVDYLRSSLGSLRQEDHTLGDELALVGAYLHVVSIRMDDRLRYRIDVPDELRRARLPALTLQPLVENAIVHGLEPKMEGGEVAIAASLQNGRLVITVQDDGLGLPTDDHARRAPRQRTGSTGTACNNIRERLLNRHGSEARLDIAPAAPTGVRATLTLPLDTP